MTMNKAGASLKCVDLKRKAQERIYARIRKMTHEEQIAYFQKRASSGRLGEWWSKAGCPPSAARKRQVRRTRKAI